MERSSHNDGPFSGDRVANRTGPGVPEGSGLSGRSPRVPGPEGLDLKAALAASLCSSCFPADRTRLLDAARAERAPESVLELLAQLPAGFSWPAVEGVWQAAGGPRVVASALP